MEKLQKQIVQKWTTLETEKQMLEAKLKTDSLLAPSQKNETGI